MSNKLLLDQIAAEVENIDLLLATLTAKAADKRLKAADLETIQDRVDALWAFVAEEQHQCWLRAVLTRSTVLGWHKTVQKAGMRGMLIYNHFWSTKGSHLLGLTMASVDSLAEADAAVDAGWRAAITIRSHKAPGSRKPQLKQTPEWTGQNYTTPKGREVVLCPAQVGRRDCNTCGLCDPLSHNRVPIIGFLIH
jgi:hypothetical protein